MYQRDWPAAGRGFLSLGSYSVMQAWRLPAQCSAQAQACWASGHFSPIFTARHTHYSSLTVVPEQHFKYALLCGTSGLLLRLLLCFKSFDWKQTEGWGDIEQNIERLWNEKTELFLGGVTETERNKTKQNSTQLWLSSCSGITLECFLFFFSIFVHMNCRMGGSVDLYRDVLIYQLSAAVSQYWLTLTYQQNRRYMTSVCGQHVYLQTNFCTVC